MYKDRIRIVRAVERDVNGKLTGRVELGIKLDDRNWPGILKRFLSLKMY